MIVAVRDRVSRFLDRECVGLSVSNTAYQPGVYMVRRNTLLRTKTSQVRRLQSWEGETHSSTGLIARAVDRVRYTLVLNRWLCSCY